MSNSDFIRRAFCNSTLSPAARRGANHVLSLSLAAILLTAGPAVAADEFMTNHFVFGPSPAAEDGAISVTTETKYDPKVGYGFEGDAAPKLVARSNGPDAGRTFVTADGPLLFSVRVPEGNYRVRLRLGDAEAESDTTVKAETRRVMLAPVRLGKGETTTVECLVNVRTDKIDEQTSVKLNDREKNPAVRHWDDKLTLEFCGKHVAVSDLVIEKVTDATTIFLAGDSTVTDQGHEPWAAWGQWLPQFFGPKVAVANYGESGRTLRSFKGDLRWAKLISQVKPGDYVFIQFGHNDMKEQGDGVGPFTSFSASLRTYIADVRGKGATPVVMTPMHRRRFDNDGKIQDTFGEYPAAIRKVAEDEKVALIDLQAMSKPLYEAMGPEKSKLMFVHFPANSFAGQDKALRDDTHFRGFGADQIARCVLQGIRDAQLPVASEIREGVPTFDPSKPGDPDAYDVPPSAAGMLVVPEGR
ncbi:MAG TPA: rhamnogalacturonan acetylesterase [Tepidisphaeraceae bacterium]|jgi:lysophospholipase L1-like esterase